MYNNIFNVDHEIRYTQELILLPVLSQFIQNESKQIIIFDN